MLVVKIQVGRETIDELWIQRVESLEEGRKTYSYIVTKPPKYKHIKVIHRRDDRWKVLLMKVLDAIVTSDKYCAFPD